MAGPWTELIVEYLVGVYSTLTWSNFKYFGWYFMLFICIFQTLYPVFMIIFMVIRQMSIFQHFFYSVNKQSTKHGGNLAAMVMKAHGVKSIFGLSGGHISPILVGAESEGIKVIDTRHEVTAVFAADAVYRLTGIPGVAVVTAGPGLTNTVTAVKNAQMAESGVVLLGGSPSMLLKGRGALQDIDHMSIFKSITKWQKTVTKVRDVVPVVREAFYRAASGVPGPVFVELPLDVLYPYQVVAKEVLGNQSKSNSLLARAKNFYLDQYLKNLFAAAFDVDREYRPWPVELPFPKKNDITQAVKLLKTAKKPLIILGSQSMIPPIEPDELAEYVESIGIPCFLGGMSRGLLGHSSPLHMRQARSQALKEADVVILAGSICDFRLKYGQSLSPKSKVIAVNRGKEQLYKNSPLFWKPSLAIQGDVGQFFKELSKHLGKGKLNVSKQWIDSLRARDDAKERTNHDMALEPAVGGEHLNPLRVLYDLEQSLDDNTIIIADGGDFIATASYIVRPRKPLSWLDPGAFGTLGCGIGFAIGAKAVKPEKNVCVIYGDGSVGYSLADFDTLNRHKLNVMAVVGNDACWTQIAREQVNMLGSPVGCNLNYTNYEKAVEALGCKGILVDEKDSKNLVNVFEQAKQMTKDGSTVLVNCLIGKTKFREGSLSV